MSIRDDIERVQQIDDLIVMLKEERTELVSNVLANMEEERIVIDGVGLIEKTKPSPSWTEWDHEAAYGAVCRKAAETRHVDSDTGEVESVPEAQLRLYRAVAAPSWRASALRSLGIEPKDYAKRKPGTPGIKIHPAGVVK